jgi:hypothetical protein
MIALVGGPAVAQNAAPKLSKADTQTMARCQGMAQDAMTKDRKCAAFMKKHPDMLKAN